MEKGRPDHEEEPEFVDIDPILSEKQQAIRDHLANAALRAARFCLSPAEIDAIFRHDPVTGGLGMSGRWVQFLTLYLVLERNPNFDLSKINRPPPEEPK